MFPFAVSDAAWRVVLAIAIGVAPYAAPPETVGAATPLVGSVRLGILAGIVLAAIFVVRKLGVKQPRTALLCAVTLLALPFASAYFNIERGPLLRSAWIVTPLVWATIAAALGGPLATWLSSGSSIRASRRVVIGLTALGVSMGIVSFALAYPVLSSRDAMWSRALLNDPANENAALAVAARARSRGDRRSSLETFLRCRRLRPKSCACAEEAAGDAIYLGRYLDARQALDATVTCERSAQRMALTSEAMIGTGDLDAGLREADLALAQDHDEPHALYARAWGNYLKGNSTAARADAERAVKLGRGAPARLLYGLLLYTAGDLDAAASEFRGVLAVEPDSAQATYDLALIAQKKNQYREAREGYLRALKLDPQMADARYNLVVLTQGLGATMEAQHHLDEFVAAFPRDPRIPSLLQLLATPAPRRAMTVGQ